MFGTIDALVLSMALFVGGHFVLSAPPIRTPIVEKIGDNPFRGLYSIFALASLVWAIMELNDAPYIELWEPRFELSLLTNILMPFAVLFLVVGLLSHNPTSVGGDVLLDEPQPPRGIMTVTRHPFLWGTGLWSLAHVSANGDLASVIFFGGMALLSFAGMPALDHKVRERKGAAWGPFELTTSIIPFMAVFQGRAELDLRGIGLWRIAVGLVVWVVLFGLHPILFGVSPHPV